RTPRHPITSRRPATSPAPVTFDAEAESPRHRYWSAPDGPLLNGACVSGHVGAAPRVADSAVPEALPASAGAFRTVSAAAVLHPADLGPAAVCGRLLSQPPDAAARRGDLGRGKGRVRRAGDSGRADLRPANGLREPLVPGALRSRQLRPARDREGRAAPDVPLGALERVQLPDRADRRHGPEGGPVRRLSGGAPPLGLPRDRVHRR